MPGGDETDSLEEILRLVKDVVVVGVVVAMSVLVVRCGVVVGGGVVIGGDKVVDGVVVMEGNMEEDVKTGVMLLVLAKGNFTEKVTEVPKFFLLVSLIVPPISSTKCLHIHSPSPDLGPQHKYWWLVVVVA